MKMWRAPSLLRIVTLCLLGLVLWQLSAFLQEENGDSSEIGINVSEVAAATGNNNAEGLPKQQQTFLPSLFPLQQEIQRKELSINQGQKPVTDQLSNPGTAVVTATCPLADDINEQTRMVQMVPSFIAIGGQKCGTTSMYSYLIRHPNVLGILSPACSNNIISKLGNNNPKTKTVQRVLGDKEIRFFDNDGASRKNLTDYVNYFPYVPESIAMNRITGESTPNYIYWPKTSNYISQYLPNIKLIAMLRNPAERAYSHFLHATLQADRFVPNISFHDVVLTEMIAFSRCKHERAAGNMIAMYECHRDATSQLVDRFYVQPGNIQAQLTGPTQADQMSRAIRKRSSWLLQVLHRGIYVDQLKPFLEHFKPSQILVIKSEDMFVDPNKVMNSIAQFLRIPTIDWSNIVTRKYNFGRRNQIEVTSATSERHPPIKPETKQILQSFFEPLNQELYDFLSQHNIPFIPW